MIDEPRDTSVGVAERKWSVNGSRNVICVTRIKKRYMK